MQLQQGFSEIFGHLISGWVCSQGELKSFSGPFLQQSCNSKAWNNCSLSAFCCMQTPCRQGGSHRKAGSLPLLLCWRTVLAQQRGNQVPCGPVLVITVEETFARSRLLQLDYGASKKHAWAGASAHTL